MGLFDFLFGSKPTSNVEVLSDRIWMSHQARISGIRRELQERLNTSSDAVLLVLHFADSLAQLKSAAVESHNSKVTVALAETLTVDMANRLNLDREATIDLIVAERHLLPDVDDKLMQFAEELPCRCRVTHHLSLEDPLLTLFNGEWLGSILGKLGMSEDEAIESKLVSRQIRNAQKKVQDQAFGDLAANSAAEWIQKNMPNATKI